MTEITNAHHIVKPGSAVEIALEGNPSTGYDWDTAASDAASLARVEIADLGAAPDLKALPPDAPPLTGAPVMRLWRVTVLRGGTARLIFNYRRPWESAAPIKTHTVTLEIAD